MAPARVQYATQAMIELAIRRGDPRPVTLRDITDRHGVPGPFLTQIMRTLRGNGWVQSIRGASGGYRIAVDPEVITLADIVDALACDSNPSSDENSADDCPSGQMVAEAWERGRRAQEEIWRSITLQDLATAVKQSGDVASMYYI